MTNSNNRKTPNEGRFDSRYGRGWKGIRAALSVLVVTGTVMSLVLPAITLNEECKLQEHQHSEACQGVVTHQLVCNAESLGVHVHSDGCYDQEKNLICGLADFVVHTHDSLCYDPSGSLVCTLPEVKEHQHTDACYEIPAADPGHAHGDSCHSWTVTENRICGLEEIQGHAHGDSCYGWTVTENRVCGQEESQGHTHSEACCEKIRGELVCALEEKEGHAHSEACYEKAKGELTCQEQERPAVPVGNEKKLTCGKPVIIPHLHVDSCYADPEQMHEGGLTKKPVEGGGLTQPGFGSGEKTGMNLEDVEKILVCKELVVDIHQHTDKCFQDVQPEPCAIPEHIHVNNCFPNQTPPAETAEQWEATLPTLTGRWNDDLMNVALSQLGYTESTENRVADDLGNIHGYTRYGHWAEDPHGPWQIPFVNFCLHYAGVPQDALPTAANLADWMDALKEAGLLTVSAEPEFGLFGKDDDQPLEGVIEIGDGAAFEEDITVETDPRKGDLVFLDRDGNSLPDAVAILATFPAEDGADVNYTIEGDYENAVTQLPYKSSQLMGFVNMKALRQAYLLAHPEAKPYSLTHRGGDYTVTARYGDSAGFPQDVTMTVRELDPDSQEFHDHVTQIPESHTEGEIYSLRLFDIIFLDGQGQKLEPGSMVDIQVVYDQAVAPGGLECAVVHFSEEAGMETIEAAPVLEEIGSIVGMEFSQDSFSVSAVIVKESGLGAIYKIFGVDARATTPSHMEMSDGTDTYHKVTDIVTVNDWKDSFINDPNNINTSRAGGVFMDKSVTAGTIEYSKGGTGGTIQAETGKFLVGLSTIGSTQAVAGVESAPVDVMFILDLSSSMYRYTDDTYTSGDQNPHSIQALVDALNTSIRALNDLNEYNRVGVTVYNGGDSVRTQSKNTHGKVMLPLGRYTLSSGTNYIETTMEGKHLTGVRTSPNLRTPTGGAVNQVVHPITGDINGTYAQMGILHALDEFRRMKDDTTVTINNAPYTRRPIFIFMSDGLPTAATNNFSNKSANAVMGNNSNGCRSAVETDFTTMLTAAYAKDQVQSIYQHEKGALFYTLGYLRGDNTVSMNLMDPSSVKAQDDHVRGKNMDWKNGTTAQEPTVDLTQLITDKWHDLVDSDPNTGITISPWVNKGSNEDLNYKSYEQKSFTVKKVDGFPRSDDDMYFVDDYFEATSLKGLMQAFTEIVLEISLQDSYDVTWTSQSQLNESGYVTFVDTIGEYMHVTDMEGIILAGELHSGLTLAQNFSDTSMGDIFGGSALGREFMLAVGNQLGLNPAFDGTGNEDFRKTTYIMDAAYNCGQLHYHSDDDFSNYIEWYASADASGEHTFLGFAHEPGLDCNGDNDNLYTCEGAGHCTEPPAGATHKIRSYFHLGPVTPADDGTLTYTNMMYSMTWVRTRLSDGQESVIFALPNSLLPTIDYTVALDINKELYSLDVSGATSPAMLAYQVGLKPGLNVTELLENDPTYRGINDKDEDGQVESVYFYSNEWYEQDKYDTVNTHAYFQPNRLNDRYYYTGPITEPEGSPTPIYVPDGKGGYTECTNKPSSSSSSGDYVEKFVYYTKVNGVLQTHVQWKPISQSALDHAVLIDGQWHIPPYTPHDMTTSTIDSNYYFLKIKNATETATWCEIPFTNTAEKVSGNYIIGTMQGNNGRLMVTPVTFSGIKTLGTLANLSHYKFQFEIHETGPDFAIVTETTDEAGHRLVVDSRGNVLARTRVDANGDPMKDEFGRNIMEDPSGKALAPEEIPTSTLLQTVQNSSEMGDKILFEPIWPVDAGNNYYVVRETNYPGVFCDETEYLITVNISRETPTHIHSIYKRDGNGVISDVNLVNDDHLNPQVVFDQLNFANRLGVELPETGGPGDAAYIFSGFAFLTAAALVYLPLRKKTRKARV